MHTIFFKSKKGVEWQISEMIVFFFGAILLIALVAFFLKLQSALFAEQDDGSIANLKRLNEEIKELLESSDDQGRTMNYFIGEDKMLLGFNTDATNSFTIIAQPKPGEIQFSSAYKPFKCGDSACLCLYNGAPGDSTDRDKNVVDCAMDGMTGKNIAFPNLGGIFPPPNLDPNKRIKQIRIEKTKQGDTYDIKINVN